MSESEPGIEKPTATPWAWVAGLAVALFGVGLIALGTALPKQSWLALFVEHLGVAVSVGGMIHLMFEIFLLRVFLAEIAGKVASETSHLRVKLREDMDSANRRLTCFDSISVYSAHTKLSIDKFVANMVSSDSVSGDGVIRVLESFAFTPGAFASVVRQALRRSRRVELLLGHPRCKIVQLRVAELKMAAPGKEAEKIADDLAVLMNDIRKEPMLAKAYKAGQIQVRVFSGIPAAAIWGVGNDLLVSWFLHQKPSINIPHIHCKADTRLVSTDFRPKDGTASLGDEMLLYFSLMWKGSVAVPAEFGLDNIALPEATPLQVVVPQRSQADRASRD